MADESRTASIVLVEDNPADVVLVRKALEQQGLKFALTCFPDGDKALKNLSQQGRLLPDLILLDLQLPKTPGIDVLKSIRGMPRFTDVPVVILTSSESAADQQRTTLLGAARYIRKPARVEEFFQAVGQGVEEMLGSTSA